MAMNKKMRAMAAAKLRKGKGKEKESKKEDDMEDDESDDMQKKGGKPNFWAKK